MGPARMRSSVVRQDSLYQCDDFNRLLVSESILADLDSVNCC